jgi:imidazolonepropionase-like amidohydrolase
LRLKLDGNSITGSGAIFFTQGQDVALEGTLEGNHVVLEFDLETRAGKPKVEALIDAEDHMQGTVTLGDYFTLVFTADRTAKEAPKVTVASKKKKKGDGRPEPPKRKGALEPYRRLMAKEIPALVEVGTAEEIEAVIKLFVDEYKLSLGLLGADEAYKVADRIREAKVSVVVPARVISMRKGRPFVLADELARHGVSVIFQSNVEDGARSLPMNAGYFVHQGMSAEDALKALTINQARLYKLDDRIGSIERGKDGDLVIFSDDPFEIGSRVLRVFISGNEVCQ